MTTWQRVTEQIAAVRTAWKTTYALVQDSKT
jgi:hypothetical protein